MESKELKVYGHVVTKLNMVIEQIIELKESLPNIDTKNSKALSALYSEYYSLSEIEGYIKYLYKF